jgi:nitroreductase
LEGLVELARLSPSAANRQPLKYILSCDRETNDLIFPCLAWAGYLKDWSGPQAGEQPTAYVVILADTTITNKIDCDHGIAVQSMLLGATEMGLGGCIFGSVNRPKLKGALDIADRYQILLVLALGKPVEEVRIEDTGPDGDIKYWRDAQGTHHVPKRSLQELILK